METNQLVCYACGESYPAGAAIRCSDGEPLWRPIQPLSKWWTNTTDWNMWRYADVLPVNAPIGVGSAAGGTPLVRPPKLDEYAGCSVHVKDEGENPTGSFKDRGSAVGVAAAVEAGIDVVGTLSYGNMGMSVAANATSAGIGCVVISPAEIPDLRVKAIGQFGPTILKTDDFSGVNQKIAANAADLGVKFLNADVPLRVEGQKTIAFEICEQLAPEVPDAIVVPVASGGHASAIWKGLLELKEGGLIDRIPRLYLTQAEASDPIARAYREGASSVSPTETDETIAFSIVNKAPLSGNRALTAARETGGAVVAVSEERLSEATSVLASEAGLCVEPASATALAGARQLVRDGDIAAEEEVVLVATGTGFKEFAGVESTARISSISPESVEDRLNEVLEAYER